MQWSVWVQPSEAATLDIAATWGADSDSKSVQILVAAIHPLVFVPGYIGTWPPEHGGDLDPLLHTFENLKEAMQKIGYEWGEVGSGATLIPFGWDWRAPIGGTGTDVLRSDIDTIENVANRTKPYVNYGQVDIIAHSAGGLVSRAFIEDADPLANNQDKVNKFITLGTPHRGAPAAYRSGRGGQYDALFFDDPQAATGVVAGLMICNGDYRDYGYRAAEIVLDEAKLYDFIQVNMPSANDLLPTSDVAGVDSYLVDSSNSSNYYPYGDPAGNPPANPFLEDMSTTNGDYNVSKLLTPKIISVYSPDYATEGGYDVDPPPYGLPYGRDDVQWGHGKVILPAIPPEEGGDSLIPTYSADLTRIPALSGASNIIAFDATNVASDTYHMALPQESSLVRQLMTYVTGIDVVNNPTLWTKAINGTSLGSLYALATCSPVRTLVTDPVGRQAGLDPVTGEIINDIPGAIVTKDGTEPHLIFVPRLQGQYQVNAVGIDQGSYTIGALEIISGATQFAGKVLTGTTSVGQSCRFEFDSAVFQEENGQVALEAEHFNWQIGQSNRSWISQTVLAGYTGAGYLNAGLDVDRLYTNTFTITSPRLEYSINFTATGTYYVWLRGYAPNAAGDSVYAALDDQPTVTLTGLPPRQWAWINRAGSGNRVTFEVTVPGEHTLFLWQREDGLRLDRLVLTRDNSYEPIGAGPAESFRTAPE